MRITHHRHESLPANYRYLKFCYYVPAIEGTFSCHLLSEVGEPWQAEARQMLRDLGLDPGNLEARDIIHDEQAVVVRETMGRPFLYTKNPKPDVLIHYANVMKVG